MAVNATQHLNPFEHFLKLVAFDRQVLSLQQQLRQRDKELLAWEKKRLEAQAGTERIKKVLHDLLKVQKECDLELASIDAELKRKKQQLETAPEHKIVTNLQREVEQLSAKQVAFEKLLLENWGQVEEQELLFEASQKETAHAVAEIETQIQKVLAQRREHEERLRALELERSAYTSAVKPEFLTIYELVRSRLEDPAVPVQDGSCFGCGNRVPMGDMGKVSRHEIVSCQQCRRLLLDQAALNQFVTGFE